jgi:hypothetical protein
LKAYTDSGKIAMFSVPLMSLLKAITAYFFFAGKLNFPAKNRKGFL